MANQLGMAKQHSIITLAGRGWSQRRIARELGVDRGTVRRYLEPGQRVRDRDGPGDPALAADATVSNAAISTAGSESESAPPFEETIGLDVPPPASVDSKPAISTAGSEGVDPSCGDITYGIDSLPSLAVGSKPAISTTGSERLLFRSEGPSVRPDPVAPAGRRSECEPFREQIVAGVDRGLSAQRIWQDLSGDQGVRIGYESVKRFVRRLRATRPLPFRRMECAPGEEAQIDFGVGAPIVDSSPMSTGAGMSFLAGERAPSIGADSKSLVVPVKARRRKTHVFRMVLSHSRKAYSEVVYRQTTDAFIQCLENAFHHFGGVPRTLVIDNLKAAVTKADWFDPDLNPKIAAFAAHYGTVILPTKPYTPRHKGKIERGVGYVKDNALKDRTFDSLEEQNHFLREWESTVADTRIHGTTRKQVGKVFEGVERGALLPLPLERFPCFKEAQRVVSRDAHVEVDKAFYSVPPEHLGRTVWARWDGRMVRIFDQRMQPIAVHAKSEPGRFRTQPEHLAPEKISRIEKGTAWLLNKASAIGANAQRWGESMLQHRGIEGVRVLQGLLSLSSRHACAEVDQACAVAQSHGAYRLRILRELIKRKAPVQEQFEFIDKHPLIRDLADYGSFVRASLTQTAWTPSESSTSDIDKSRSALIGNGFTALTPIPKSELVYG